MRRALVRAGVVGLCSGVVGCADTWDTVTSRSFRDRPFHHMFGKDDPLHTLRTTPEGSARVNAMLKLQEPLSVPGGTQADQDEVVDHILGPAATADPSPVVRAAALDALGRFRDERAVGYMIAAYHQATGRPDDPFRRPPAPDGVVPAGATTARGGAADRPGLAGPSGFPPEAVDMLRAKALDGLARTGRPDAARLLTQVAAGDVPGGDLPDRDTRLAAVRGLGRIRDKESVAALAKVLAAESGKDPALAGRAHIELVSLTGKNLPPDPDKWAEVVAAGAVVSGPEPSFIERAVGRGRPAE